MADYTQTLKEQIFERISMLLDYQNDYIEDLIKERDEAERKLSETKKKLEMMIAKYEQ